MVFIFQEVGIDCFAYKCLNWYLGLVGSSSVMRMAFALLLGNCLSPSFHRSQLMNTCMHMRLCLFVVRGLRELPGSAFDFDIVIGFGFIILRLGFV